MKHPIKCTETGCRCAIGWIERDERGEKVISFAAKHHGQKHEAKFTEKELMEKLKEV